MEVDEVVCDKCRRWSPEMETVVIWPPGRHGERAVSRLRVRCVHCEELLPGFCPECHCCHCPHAGRIGSCQGKHDCFKLPCRCTTDAPVESAQALTPTGR